MYSYCVTILLRGLWLTTAAHAWDLAGAKRCGFITAYTLVYEYAECEDMWGKQDIVAPDLAQLGKAIVAKYGRKA